MSIKKAFRFRAGRLFLQVPILDHDRHQKLDGRNGDDSCQDHGHAGDGAGGRAELKGSDGSNCVGAGAKEHSTCNFAFNFEELNDERAEY